MMTTMMMTVMKMVMMMMNDDDDNDDDDGGDDDDDDGDAPQGVVNGDRCRSSQYAAPGLLHIKILSVGRDWEKKPAFVFSSFF